jgi:hypothetical protein
MKLICFPHYTCGGLLCDILNDTFSHVAPNKGLSGKEHNLGKIGDVNTVNRDFSITDFVTKLESMSTHNWIGTHCWPGKLPLNKFDCVICVTTMTWPSKLYRWLRSYHHYFATQWTELTGIELVDKIRETAKNYHVSFEPVIASNVINLEFAEVVENSVTFQQAVHGHDTFHHMERWKSLNTFLYQDSLWQNNLVKAFYQAELELHLKQHYKYE